VKEVLHPLRDSHKEQILTEVEIRAVFSETESILNYNKEERVAKWSVSQRLGKWKERKERKRGEKGNCEGGPPPPARQPQGADPDGGGGKGHLQRDGVDTQL
jgi:hypothetical protein